MQNNTFSTLFVGQNFIKLNEVDSTNNFLKNLASKSEPLPEGTVIMADNQFAGRGQQENVWESENGRNLSISFYFRPTFLPLNKQFYLNMAISLAVAEAMSQFSPEPVQIKWPNDIYYNHKKIGGILIENTLTGTTIKSSVVGIGLNINQLKFSSNIDEKTISLIQIVNTTTDLLYVLSKICVFMEQFYLMLKAGNYKVLQNYYLNRLYKYQIPSLFKKDGLVFEGTITKVEDDGKLVLETNEGFSSYAFKEIQFT